MSYSRRRLNEVVALQKAILNRIEADLGEFGNSPRRKYIQEFQDEFQTFAAVCNAGEIVEASAEANLVWIGDYHALVRSRTYAADLLRQIAARKDSKIALGVEVVFARHQKILDLWMRGVINDEEFLGQVRYFEQWGCDWPSYKILFDTARELDIPVYGVDCNPRSDMRRIGRRDQAVARRISRLVEKDPSRTFVVVFGESHLASAHLPRRVRAILEKTGTPCNELLVLQNLDAVYWGLQRKGLEGIRSVRIQSRQYCVFNATPMEKYESFRQYLLRCVDEGEGPSDWTLFVHTLIDVIFDFLEIDKQPDLMDYLPKVYSEISAEHLPEFLVQQEMPAAQVKLALAAIHKQGASYIPELNSMFIDEFRLDYTAEEAARFIYQLCRGDFQNSPSPSPLAEGEGRVRGSSDLFFLAIIERAFGYFFSKLLDSSRDGAESLGARLPQYIGYNEELARTVNCLLDPGKRPSWQHFERLRTVVEQNPSRSRMLQLLTQVLGYALGRRLHKAYLESRISRKEIHALLHDPLLAPDRPLKCYAGLSTL